MHLEPLEKLPRSVRDFLSHYAMIVLSILTALALEQVALGIEHRHEGARAKEEVEQEIASNRKMVEEALQITRENKRDWEALFARTVADVRAGQSTDESLEATLREAGNKFRDALPPLKTTAWDAAISDHSVNYLAHEDLVHYSELYATQRLFTQAMWDVIRDSAARDLSAISLAVALGNPDGRATVATLNGRLRTIGIIESQLLQVDQMLKGATSTVETAPAPASGAAPAAITSASAPSH
jgi:hypothetical protein